MAKTEVYQIRLDSDEKKLAFAVFRQLGLTPAQAIRMFFRQVVLTQSIPFQIESKSIQPSLLHTSARDESAKTSESDENHLDIFTELDQILNSDKK
jgi:addiction module RelB/DinJ family antitoxin